ncbi:unnamed protein product [Protopolystoma xenopodis]|uniref:Uncharacterized protein n=1 Tax=Protopolystoma xenopodis TaxID=117903 RepID=A0A3S5CKG2_9PLAT|nr:unnamed protein product [Protopolystoma xenopodis]
MSAVPNHHVAKQTGLMNSENRVNLEQHDRDEERGSFLHREQVTHQPYVNGIERKDVSEKTIFSSEGNIFHFVIYAPMAPATQSYILDLC